MNQREAFVFDVPGSRKWRIVRIDGSSYALEYLNLDEMRAPRWSLAQGERASWAFIWHAAKSAEAFHPNRAYWDAAPEPKE